MIVVLQDPKNRETVVYREGSDPERGGEISVTEWNALIGAGAIWQVHPPKGREPAW